MTMSATIGPHLPYLRRYARALTGSQTSGDNYVRVLLEALLDGNVRLDEDLPPRVALYRLFHEIWERSAYSTSAQRPTRKSTPEQRLQAIQPDNREALLLTAVEEFPIGDVAVILDCTEEEVDGAVEAALKSIDRDLESRVLIVEDEAVIAMDLENLVYELGHRVAGIATTRDDAVRIAREQRPELVLTDIKLADGSSGVDAALAILKDFDIPVVFITAYPEFLLTGQRPEPIYLITKPFSRDTVRATIGQALFFHRPRLAAA
jgi:CheY-like chemotaxis protein/DNA-directed RNA polymerase specialized sigma24 family protein